MEIEARVVSCNPNAWAWAWPLGVCHVSLSSSSSGGGGSGGGTPFGPAETGGGSEENKGGVKGAWVR